MPITIQAPETPRGNAHEFTAALGMWVFLATEFLFIGAMFAGYSIVRVSHPAGFALASRETDVVLGTVNTAILLTSSLTMAFAVEALRRGERRALVRWLWITAALGSAFLGIKAVEYVQEWEHGRVPGLHFTATGPYAREVALFFFLYFAMTGLHALHLLIGVILIAGIAWLAARGRFSPQHRSPVDNAGLYWHFVDVVWVFLYPLLYLIGRA